MAGELWQSSAAIGRESLGTAEVQTVSLTGITATGGTFTLSYNGQTTSALAYNAAAAAVQTALRLLPSLAGTVMTVGGTLPGGLTLTFSGTLLGPQPAVVGNGAALTPAGGVVTTVRTTPGISAIGVAVPATRKAYYDTGLVLSRTRAPRPHAFMVGRRDNNLAVTMGPVQAGGTATFPISSSEIIEPLLATVRGSVVPTSLTAGSAEVQTITGTNTPTGGTFTLSFLGQTTAPIAFGATGAAIGTALNLLTTITAAGGVGVPTGGPFNTTPVVVTFLGVGNVPSIIGNGSGLTGAGIQPGVVVTETTPGVPSVNLWTFTPGNVLDSQTWQWFDGARAWNEVGVRGGSIKVTGDVNTATTVTMTLAGQNLLAGPITGGLADRTPDFSEGWETRIYLDPFGSAPGVTPVDGTVISWDFTLNNNPDWKYTASNTLAAAAVLLGNLTLSGTIKFEASTPTAATEFSNWDGGGTANPVLRMLRMSFGNNNVLSGAFNTFVTVDCPISWSSFDLGQTDGATRAYNAAFSYVYDPNNGYGLQIRCQNNRSAAYI